MDKAWDELELFAENFGIPVGETHAGRGAIKNESHILVGGTGVLGTQAACHFAEKADLVFCIGTRLGDFVTGSNSAFQNPNVKFISINVSGHDAYKIGSLPIESDARLALQALIDASKEAGIKSNPNYVNEISKEKRKWESLVKNEVYVQHSGEKINQGHLIGIINNNMKKNDTLVAAAGTIPADLTKLFNASNGRKLHLEFGNSCMGYDIPAAIGVKMAHPNTEVFILMGDGNYQLHPMELVTAIQERTKITVILNVNYGFQSIHGHQKGYVGHSLGNEFKVVNEKTKLLDDGEFIEIDYVKIAEGIGLRTWYAINEEEIIKALKEARIESKSCMIVVPTEKYRYAPDSGVWWEVIGAEVTNDAKTKELVKLKESGRKKQRYYI